FGWPGGPPPSPPRCRTAVRARSFVVHRLSCHLLTTCGRFRVLVRSNVHCIRRYAVMLLGGRPRALSPDGQARDHVPQDRARRYSRRCRRGRLPPPPPAAPAAHSPPPPGPP